MSHTTTTSIKSARKWIPEFRVEELTASLVYINRRAAKLGCPAVTIEELGRETRKVTGPGGREHRIVFVEVELRGSMPKLPGWSLVAVVSHEDNVVDVVPGEVCPAEQRTRGPVCDHCKRTDARRKKTMVLRHDDNIKHVQVGTSCIADFLGSHAVNPEAALMLATLVFRGLDEFGDVSEDFFGEGGGWRTVEVVPMRELLIKTAKVLTLLPWVSKSKARDLDSVATADVVLTELFPPKREQGKDDADRKWTAKVNAAEIDESEVDRAIAWVKTEGSKLDASDYILNLAALVEAEEVSARRFGYACSILPSYRRVVERERVEAARLDEHFGTEGERVVLTLTVVGDPRTIDSSFGVSYLHSFRDAEGRTFKWFGSAHLRNTLADDSRPVLNGDVVVVKATIKRHGEYKGAKETGLSRVALFVPKEKKARTKKVEA